MKWNDGLGGITGLKRLRLRGSNDSSRERRGPWSLLCLLAKGLKRQGNRIVDYQSPSETCWRPNSPEHWSVLVATCGLTTNESLGWVFGWKVVNGLTTDTHESKRVIELVSIRSISLSCSFFAIGFATTTDKIRIGKIKQKKKQHTTHTLNQKKDLIKIRNEKRKKGKVMYS